MLTIYDCNNWFRRRAETVSFGSPVRLCFQEIQGTMGTVIMVWDGKGGKAARQKIYPEYKAKRNKPDDGFFELQRMFREISCFTKATQICVDGYEADDVIAHVVINALSNGMAHKDIFIHSNDSDFLRLGVPMAREKGKVKPELMDAYKTLVGDSSDNIPGAKLFGQKSWDAVLELGEDKIEFLMEQIIHWDKREPEYIIGACGGWYPKSGLEWFSKKENREQLNKYLQIIRWLPMDWDLICQNSTPGLNKPGLAEPIFKQFML